jgi:outer membrane protein TolC
MTGAAKMPDTNDIAPASDEISAAKAVFDQSRTVVKRLKAELKQAKKQAKRAKKKLRKLIAGQSEMPAVATSDSVGLSTTVEPEPRRKHGPKSARKKHPDRAHKNLSADDSSDVS